MITPTTSATQNTTTTQATGQPSSSALTSDFETFLKMLTAQARYQDPLEPLDSSEYASQLAQFSMVEQQVQSNELLSTLTLALSNTGLDQLADWVGLDVQTTAAFRFDATPVTLSAAADSAADRAVMVIRNASGDVIDRLTVPVDQNQFTWAGVDAAGNPVLAGTYTAALESYAGDTPLAATAMAVYGKVREARFETDQIILTLDSGVEISSHSVSGVRAGA